MILFGATTDMSNIFYEGILQNLIQDGWDVHLVSNPGPVGKKLLNGKAHTIEMSREISIGTDVKSLFNWVLLLRKIRPRVLIVGTPKASLLGVVAARIARVPRIVYVAHGLRSETVLGLKKKILVFLEYLTQLFAHQTLAVSHSLKKAIEDAHPRFKGRVQVLGYGSMNGVELDRFRVPSLEEKLSARNALNLPSKSVIVGFVGRINKDKGGDLLAALTKHEAFTRLRLHLLIIGELEDDDLREAFIKLVNEGQVTITGWIDFPEEPLAAVDVLLHPTQREGLGMSLLEAQAMGVPVLTNAVTGTVDAVTSGEGGFFADDDSVESWVSKIDLLVSDPKLRDRMGRAGRQFVSARFNRDDVAARFSHFVEQFKK